METLDCIPADMRLDKRSYFSSCKRATSLLINHSKIVGPTPSGYLLAETFTRFDQIEFLHKQISIGVKKDAARMDSIKEVFDATGDHSLASHPHMRETSSFENKLYLECLYAMAFRCFDITRFINKYLFEVDKIGVQPSGLIYVRNHLIFHPEKHIPFLNQALSGGIGDPQDFDFFLRPQITIDDRRPADKGLRSNMEEFRSFWIEWVNKCLSKLYYFAISSPEDN